MRSNLKRVFGVAALALSAAVPMANSVEAAGGSFNCYGQTITTKTVTLMPFLHEHRVNGVTYTVWTSSNVNKAWPNHSGTWYAHPSGSYVCVYS